MGPPEPVQGCQTPRIELVPPAVSTAAAEEAIEIAGLARITLDPWEERVIRGAHGLDSAGYWAAVEVGLIVARQNGKGTCIEVSALAGLFGRVPRKIVYTAHLMATSRKIRERVQFLIESCSDLDKEVKQIRVSNEEQSIVLKPRPVLIVSSESNGSKNYDVARMDFVARTGAAARGWTNYDIIFFDEAFALTVEQVGAIMPIMFARPDWQIWYASMGGMANSHALRQVRVRAINGDPELAYFEWSVDEVYHEAPEYVANMPAAWAQANPALGIRITTKTIRRAQRMMDPDEFAREVLCVWDDPGGMMVIHPGLWARLIDILSEIVSGVVFAVDCSPGLTSGAIGVAGYRSDGIPHAEITSRDGVVDHRPGVNWIVPRMKELDDAWHPAAWIIDGSGPARALLTRIRKAGIEPVMLTSRELGEACGMMMVAVNAPNADRLRHLGQECTTEAIKALTKRDIVDAWVWSRKTSDQDITPMMVMTMALHGLAVHDVAMYDVLESVR